MQSIDEVGATAAHVAVVMDGNGRWATRRGLPRAAGHAAGIDALQRTVEAAPALGVTTMTVFDAFRLTLAGQLLLGRIFSPWNIVVDGLGAAAIATLTAGFGSEHK